MCLSVVSGFVVNVLLVLVLVGSTYMYDDHIIQAILENKPL